MKDASTAYRYQKFLRDSGFWVKAIFSYCYQKNTCIRFSICAFHDLEDINSLISSFSFLYQSTMPRVVFAHGWGFDKTLGRYD